jgi:hypothetical protein
MPIPLQNNPTEIMKKTPTLPLAAALAVAFASVTHAATVVYTETFGNATTGIAAISTTGWQVNYGSSGTAYSGSTLSIGGIGNGAGGPQNLSNVGQNQTSSSQTNGFIFFGSGTNPALAWTSEYNDSVNNPLTRDTLSTISFYQNNNGAVDYRLALRVNTGSGEQWFASTLLSSTTIGTAANFNTTAEQLSLDNFKSENWRLITLNPNVTLSLGATDVALADGTITGFGVYRAGGQVSRVDSYVISVIPEPSGAMLFGAAGFLVLLRRRP